MPNSLPNILHPFTTSQLCATLSLYTTSGHQHHDDNDGVGVDVDDDVDGGDEYMLIYGKCTTPIVSRRLINTYMLSCITGYQMSQFILAFLL